MSNTAIIVIAVAVAVVVVVALLLNRRMTARWGNKSVETGTDTRHVMKAKGGSRIERARQAGPGDKSMVAEGESEIVDAEQDK